MTGTETDTVIEWRAAPSWALQWLALMLFVALPFLALGAWMAANSIATAPEGTWPAYLFFLGAFATLIIGTLVFGVLRAIVAFVRLLFDREPVLRADRYGLRVRMFGPVRTVKWSEIAAIEIERKRRQGRYVQLVNHILVRLRDEGAPELAIKPQLAGHSLEYANEKLNALYGKFR